MHRNSRFTIIIYRLSMEHTCNGPFENFMGVVEEVNVEKQTLRAKISMFGRETPVELDFSQVDKI